MYIQRREETLYWVWRPSEEDWDGSKRGNPDPGVEGQDESKRRNFVAEWVVLWWEEEKKLCSWVDSAFREEAL